MTALNHDELRDLVPIYALDALPGNEGLEVQAHLETCRTCQEFLDSYLQATGSLALAAEPLAPPDALRQRLMEAVAATPQAPRLLRPVKVASSGRGRFGWERVTSLMAVAALLAVAAFSVSLVQRLHQKDQQISRQSQFVQALGGGAPVTTVSLVGVGGDGHASGQVLVAAGGRSGGVVVNGLTDPGSKVYKLWLIVNNQPVPLKTFRPDASGVALVAVNADLTSMQGMAVTLESQPDLPTPQGPKVLQTA